MKIEKVGSVIVPATSASFDPALRFRGGVRFYKDVLGMKERFRDGNRYAAFDCNGVTVALAAPPERPVGSEIAIALRVDDVFEWQQHLTDQGAQCSEPVEGGHELRLTVKDPFGHDVILYSSLKST